MINRLVSASSALETLYRFITLDRIFLVYSWPGVVLDVPDLVTYVVTLESGREMSCGPLEAALDNHT